MPHPSPQNLNWQQGEEWVGSEREREREGEEEGRGRREGADSAGARKGLRSILRGPTVGSGWLWLIPTVGCSADSREDEKAPSEGRCRGLQVRKKPNTEPYVGCASVCEEKQDGAYIMFAWVA